MRLRLRTVCAVLPLCLVLVAATVTTPPAGLTIDNIMRGPGLVGYEPREVRWSGDGQRIFFSWKRPTDAVLAELDTYVVNRDGTGLRKLSEDEARVVPPARAERSHDKSKLVYAREGDLYVYDLATDRGRRLTHTGEIEGAPHFLRDSRRVSYVHANNLYVLTLEDGSVEKLTNIRGAGAAPPAGPQGRAAADGEERKGTESQEYLKAEEKKLLDIVRQRADKKKLDEERRKRDNPRKPHPLTPRQTIVAMELSPDGKYVIAQVRERDEKTIRTAVPNYVTETTYPETLPSRTLVGDVQERSRLAVISTETGEWKWVESGTKPAAQKLAATRPETAAGKQPDGGADAVATEAEAAVQETQEKEAAAPREKERGMQLGMPEWSEDGTRSMVAARADDNKDLWIMALDPASAKTRVITAIHDDAWVGGPGLSGFGGPNIGFMQDDRTIYFQSEQTGYSHLYTVSFDGGEPKPLTSGRWEVLRAQLSDDKSRFFLESNEGDASQHQVYVMAASGGERTRLTQATGFHQATFSRDEKYLADLFGYITKPTELYVQEARTGAEPRKLTSSPAPDFAGYRWMEPETVSIPARDGAKVPGHLFRPARAKRNGPAVIFVHGAGYAQNVHLGWSSYYREFMFHNLLASRGYTVLQLDYRASAGYGRAWRTAIYRHMGGKDLEDQVDAARWLAEQQGVDAKRIGIYGGSYGGFITLMAMFTQPDVFAAGAALRPVTDWAHYNHTYTSNILTVPQQDAEAYHRSSPIYFAEGLKGALLICHGMVDTNVHFQDSVRLVQRLIELKKQNWQVAVYPVEDHGFVQPASWTDEYKRILKLFDDNLQPGK